MRCYGLSRFWAQRAQFQQRAILTNHPFAHSDNFSGHKGVDFSTASQTARTPSDAAPQSPHQALSGREPVRRSTPVRQLALFDDQNAGPIGLRYLPEFISTASEQKLIAGVLALPLESFQFGAFQGHRRMKSFGFRYDHTLQRLQPSEPVPEWL